MSESGSSQAPIAAASGAGGEGEAPAGASSSSSAASASSSSAPQGAMAHVALSERRKIQLEKDRAAAEKVGISPVASEPFSYGSTGEPDSPELYLVMHNIAKQRNIGNMIRSAVAFGVKELIVVSRTSSLNMPSFGAQGSRRFLNIRRFERMDEAKEWMVANDIALIGIEIMAEAKTVQSHPFRRKTALIAGNEGDGLTDKVKELCDGFVYIEQYGHGIHCLNVNVSTAIVLHQFGVWAGFKAQAMDPDRDKFVVQDKPDPKSTPLTEAQLALRAKRQAKKRARAEAEAMAAAGGDGAGAAKGGAGDGAVASTDGGGGSDGAPAEKRGRTSAESSSGSASGSSAAAGPSPSAAMSDGPVET